MIPYFEPPLIRIGSFVLEPNLALVALGFAAGLWAARQRGVAMGLAARDVVDGAVFMVGMGFVFGHALEVLWYRPQQFQTDGWIALARVWQGQSSVGGFIGTAVGSAIFYRFIRRRPWLPPNDAVCFAFPISWTICRLGCFSVHDHIGVRTDFFLAVDFPGGARHDLGLYEAILSAAIAATFWMLRKRRLPVGFFLGAFGVIYAPARFALDFLRAPAEEGGDLRYAGLTPAQWGMFVLLAAGAALLARKLFDKAPREM